MSGYRWLRYQWQMVLEFICAYGTWNPFNYVVSTTGSTEGAFETSIWMPVYRYGEGWHRVSDWEGPRICKNYFDSSIELQRWFHRGPAVNLSALECICVNIAPLALFIIFVFRYWSSPGGERYLDGLRKLWKHNVGCFLVMSLYSHERHLRTRVSKVGSDSGA